MAHRAAKVRVGLVAVALGALAAGGRLAAADPPGLPVSSPARTAPAERPFPEFDPAASTPLPPPRPAVSSSQKPQPPAVPELPPAVPPPPVPGGDPYAEPPIAPRNPDAPTPQPPDNARVNLPQGPRQRIKFGPRYSEPPSWKLLPSDDQNTQKLLYTGGVIVSVNYYAEGGAAAPTTGGIGQLAA